MCGSNRGVGFCMRTTLSVIHARFNTMGSMFQISSTSHKKKRRALTTTSYFANTTNNPYREGTASPTKQIPNNRAETQARYRARHRESEQAKARERMRRLRESCREVDVSSEVLRASSVFARYRIYLREHIVKIWTDDANVEAWNAEWQRICNKEGPPFNRQDAIFLLRHDHPNPNPSDGWPTDEEIERRLHKLNSCDVVLEYADDEVGDWRAVLSRTPVGSNDDDLEWLFRHTIPTPTMEGMGACGCI
ncbi:hypothetical protein B0H11DRAFT_1934584 [Mycena galericulata]|nr:hypothetical protein B0H11DRAFT_1934584 [Mycena galericulata]